MKANQAFYCLDHKGNRGVLKPALVELLVFGAKEMYMKRVGDIAFEYSGYSVVIETTWSESAAGGVSGFVFRGEAVHDQSKSRYEVEYIVSETLLSTSEAFIWTCISPEEILIGFYEPPEDLPKRRTVH